ncbi:MAG: TMEM165/GDT1 family protein [Acidimicrobiales bacterium]|jgi:putative Ca2+/H+ antiporter (TMEM165/GDT1 family)
MNLGVLLATFALVIPAELPDKTFISCIVMASRHRALPVWIGGASALILQAGIAVVAGRLLALLPHTVVRSVVAALFIGGAAYLIFVPEHEEASKGEELGERASTGQARSSTWWRPMLTTFSIVALAEFGDITQILIANLSARYHATWSVFAGASAAFIVVSGFGVVGGRAIIRVVPLAIVRRLSGGALLGLGIYTIVGLV